MLQATTTRPHRMWLLASTLALSACAAQRGSTVDTGAGWGPSEGLSEPAEPRAGRTPKIKEKPTARSPWSHAAQLRTLKRVGGRGPSDHLGGTVERTVWTNDLASSYPILGSERRFARGALIAQRHHRPNEQAILNTFVMLKGPPGSAPAQSDWIYVVLDGSDRVIVQGRLTRCHRCHAEARHDHVFGPPM